MHKDLCSSIGKCFIYIRKKTILDGSFQEVWPVFCKFLLSFSLRRTWSMPARCLSHLSFLYGKGVSIYICMCVCVSKRERMCICLCEPGFVGRGGSAWDRSATSWQTSCFQDPCPPSVCWLHFPPFKRKQSFDSETTVWLHTIRLRSSNVLLSS